MMNSQSAKHAAISYTLLSEVPKAIFRTYDIRGIVEEELTESVIYTIARAFGGMSQEKGVRDCVIARDGRLTSECFGEALAQGLLDSGIHIVDLGVVPTPLLYFALKRWEAGSGVMLTASHNPANYNGLKLMLADQSLCDAQILELHKRILEKKFGTGEGTREYKTIQEDYISYIKNTIAPLKPFKIVIDCGNAVPGVIAPSLFRALGCEVIELHCALDGRFPNHHPDPSVMENLGDLKNAVNLHQADVGFAFDGDGDRIGVVTNKGEIIAPDRQLMVFARDVLRRKKGSPVIYDVKCSHQLREVIEQEGGIPYMWKTGHSLIKNKMKETNAVLAGEMSGHIFFNERWFGFDDGLYTGVRLLEILTHCGASSHELFKSFPQCYSTPEIKVVIAEQDKQIFVKKFIEEAVFENAHILLLDGIRVEYPHCWGVLRASNTGPALTLRFEGDTKEALHEIQQKFKDVIFRVDKTLLLPF